MADGSPAATHAPEAKHSQPAAPVVQQPMALLEEVLPLGLCVQRAAADPRDLRPAEVLALQRAAGNRAVSRLLQAKPVAYTGSPVGYTGSPVAYTGSPLGDAPSTPRPGYSPEAYSGADSGTPVVRQTGGGPLVQTDRVETQVVQRDDGGAVSSAPTAAAAGAAAPNPAPATATAQTAYVAAKTHTREVTAEPQGDGAKKAAQVEKGKLKTEHRPMDAVTLAGDATTHIQDKEGHVLWYRVEGPAYEYIRGQKVVPMAAATEVKEEDKKDERWKATKAIGEATPTGVGGQVSELFGEGLSAGDEILCLWSHWLGVRDAQEGLSAAMEAQAYGVNMSESVVWAGIGILGFAGGIAKLTAKDASVWDKLQAWGNIASAAVSVTGGVSQIVGTAAEKVAGDSEGTTAAKNAARAGAVAGSSYATGEAISAVMSSVGIIKAIVETAQSIMDRKQGKAVSKEEWVKHAHDIGAGLLSTTKGVLRSVRTFGETFAKETSKFAMGGLASTALTSVAVGIDIALATIALIEHTYYMIKQIMHYISMKRMEARLEKELGGKESVSQSRRVYKAGGAKVATLESMLEEKKKEIKDNDDDLTKLKTQQTSIAVQMGVRPTASTQKQLDKIQVKQDKAKGKKAKLEKEISEIEGRIADYKKDMTQYEAQAGNLTGAATGPRSREELRKVNLAHEIRIVDRKRIVRQLMHISADLSNITGGALYLGGITAAAGMSAKAGAMAIEASMPVTRFVKQKVHNKVAERAAMGKSIDYPGKMPGFLKISEGKGAAAKESARKQQALDILQLAAGLARFAPGMKSQDKATRDKAISDMKAEMADLEAIIKSTGVSVSKLYSLNGKPEEQAALLYKAIAKRELFA